MQFWQTMKAGIDELFPKIPMRSVKRKKPGEGRRVNSEWVALGLFALAGLIFLVSMSSVMSRAYVDLGDGNYLYTSSRMADGLMLYRDFLSPQPPMHLVVGSWLVRLGRLFGSDGPLYTARIFAMLVRLLTACWLYLLGRRLTQTPYGGFIAGLIYLALPIGYWWTLGYQSETQEMFWLIGALWFFLNFRPLPMALSGVMMALAVLSNMTAAPYAVASAFYLFVRHGLDREKTGAEGWRLVGWYVGPMAAVLGIVIAYYQIRTGAYFENVIFNQVGSYPTDSLMVFLSYCGRKIREEGGDILMLEGTFIILGILGLLLYNRTDTRREREYVVWFALALFLSFLFVTKGGTADYIFVIGEPAVALFASLFLVNFFYPSTFRRFKGKALLRDTTLVAHLCVMALMGLVMIASPLAFQYSVQKGYKFEQREMELEAVELFVRRYSKPDDRIVAQPYYAFVSDRLLAEEVSEWFLWVRRYQNEMQSMLIHRNDDHAWNRIVDKIGEISDPVSKYLFTRIPQEQRPELMELSRNPEKKMSRELREALVDAMNTAMQSRDFVAPERLEGLAIPAELRELAGGEAIGSDLLRRNRLLLETTYAGMMEQSEAARGAWPEGIATMRSIARMLEKREIPVVVANVSPANPLVLGPVEIKRAVQQNYEPVFEGRDFERMKTMNFQMQVFVPKGTLQRATKPTPRSEGLELPGDAGPSIDLQ